MKKNVKKLMEQSFLFSIGIASMAREKAEKLVMGLIKKGRLNEKQGRKLVTDLIRRSKTEKKKIENRFKRIRVTEKKMVRKKKAKKGRKK